VAAVLLFHGGYGWAKGGYLGVSTFFTLSGFLITGLLVNERAERGAIDLARFWARRFRRLLPAMLAALVGVAVFAALVADGDQLARIRTDALATLGYVANWRFIVSGQRYVDLFAAPSPVLHAWSLAVEEQFYLFFPLLVAGVLALTGGRRRGLAIVLAALSVASVALSVALHDDHTRVYYGTDTRVAELLLGALLAIWAAGPSTGLAERRRPAVAGLGVAAAAVTVVAWVTVDQTSDWLYVGGFAAYGLVSTALVAAAVAPGPVRRVLAFAPLRWLGLISYGVYLYHWPLFLVLTPARVGFGGVALFGLRLGVTLAVAVASYLLVEQPVRKGALPGRRALVAAPVAAAVVALVLVAVTVPPGPPARLAADEPGPAPAARPDPFGGPVRVATAADPLRVLVVGDSVSYDAEPGLLAALRATGAVTVEAENRLGFGLTSHFVDWRTDWPRFVRDVRPEVVITFFGDWDETFLAREGPEAYARLLDEAFGILGSGGARLLVVGVPVNVNREGVQHPRETRASFQAAVARLAPMAAFLDLDPVLTPGATFRSHLEGPGGLERVRKLDGHHLCPAGAARIGRAAVDALAPAWSLPAPDPSWRAGDWALDPRYDEPPGSCPE